jgi:hypothetical protein
MAELYMKWPLHMIQGNIKLRQCGKNFAENLMVLNLKGDLFAEGKNNKNSSRNHPEKVPA